MAADRLTPMQRKLVECFNGSIKEAAAQAGCSYQYARRLFSSSGPELFHQAIQAKDEMSTAMAAEALASEKLGRVATQQEIMEFWTEVMLDDMRADGTRLDASSKLAKAKGMFIDRIKHEGGDTPIKVKKVDLRERINSLLDIEGDEPPEDFLD